MTTVALCLSYGPAVSRFARHCKNLALPVLALVMLPVSLLGQNYFQATRTFPAGTSSGAMVAADFNGDGKADVAVLDPTSAQVDVLLGDGQGNLGTATTFAVGANPTLLVTADFNGDGDIDLAVADANGVEVLLGKGDGTFGAPLLASSQVGAPWIGTADLNNDGKVDLAIEAADGKSLNVLLGNGDGTFQAAINTVLAPGPPPSPVSNLVLADWNQDQKTDIIFVNPLPALFPNCGVSFVAGNADGTFSSPTDLYAFTNIYGISCPNFAVGDINGDNIPDLVTAGGYNGGAFDGPIEAYATVFGNHALPNFFIYGNGYPPVPGVIGDFTGDGVADLFAVDVIAPGTGAGGYGCPYSYTGGSPSSATGGFACGINIPFPTLPSGTAFADFNGDGAADFAASANGQVSLINTVSLPKPVVTGPGTTDFGSVTIGSLSGSLINEPFLGNTGPVPAIIQSLVVSGANSADFVTSSTCINDVANLTGGIQGLFIPPGGCVMGTFFNPTAAGARTATLTITYLHGPAPIVISLTGTGVSPLTTSATTISFGNYPLQLGPSPAQTITVTNTSSSAVDISSVTLTGAQPGDFAQTNNCPATLAVNASCTANVQFAPTATGVRNANLTITFGTLASTLDIALTGTGVSDAINLTNGGAATMTVSQGQTATYSLSLGGNGFSGTANLSCTGAPQGATCTVPATQAIDGAQASTFTVSVTTTAPTTAAASSPSPLSPWLWATGLWAGIALCGTKRRVISAKRALPIAMGLLLPLVLFLSSCGGSSHTVAGSPPPGTYSLTVTATASSVPTDTVTLTLVVQ